MGKESPTTFICKNVKVIQQLKEICIRTSEYIKVLVFSAKNKNDSPFFYYNSRQQVHHKLFCMFLLFLKGFLGFVELTNERNTRQFLKPQFIFTFIGFTTWLSRSVITPKKKQHGNKIQTFKIKTKSRRFTSLRVQ